MTLRSRPNRHSREGRLERRYLRAALIVALALAGITVIVFVGVGPSSSFEIRGDFASANGLEPGNPVRIAGVDIGKVSAITAGSHNTSVITMEITNSGLPIHSNATLAIKPRLALEGNFYVALDPGSPNAPDIASGGVIPERNTSVPVQIDQVLNTFDLPTRNSLQGAIQELARGLGNGGTPTTKAGGVPTGYGGLRDAIRALKGALPNVAQVATDAQGTQPGDLDRAVRFSRDFTSELARSPAALADLVSSFNTVAGALAREDQALGASVEDLDAVARVAPPSLAALDAALPELTSFARRLDPVLRAAPAPLRQTTQLVAQVNALVGNGQLPALLDRLAPVTASLPVLEQRLTPLLPLVTRVDRCLSGNVVPALEMKVPDGSLSTGDPAFLDLFHAVTGIASITGGFDGNGSALRVGLGEGASTLAGILPGLGPAAGLAPTFAGVRPTWLGYGVEPPYRPDQWCDQQPLPNLATAAGPAPAWDRALSTKRVSRVG